MNNSVSGQVMSQFVFTQMPSLHWEAGITQMTDRLFGFKPEGTAGAFTADKQFSWSDY